MSHLIDPLSGKTKDDIHIDIIEAKLTCKLICVYRLRCSRLSSDKIKCLLVKGLGINRDSGDTMFFQDEKLILRNGICPSRLDGKFDIRSGKIYVLRSRDDPVQL